MKRPLLSTEEPCKPPVPQNGAAIRSLREKDGYSQESLARVIGMNQSGLSHIELERRAARPTTLNKIARALSVPVAAIMRQSAEDSAA